MKFQVLGQVEAWREGARIEVRSRKMRTFLAALLLARGRIVSDALLMDMLWDEDLPSTAQAQIQTYASRLRGLLGGEALIERRPPGYRLRAPSDALDLDLIEFERLASQGHEALEAGRLVEAGATLRKALALWRGQPLAGVTDHLAVVEQPRFEEAKLTALGDRIEADLGLGEHATLITELTGLVAANPFHERPRIQLMLALHRSGRTADALSTYQNFRRGLVDELGLDPSSEMQHVHQSILAGDAKMRPSPKALSVEDVRVAGLSPAAHDFTGRSAEVARACASLTESRHERETATTCVITGMDGAGKTTLALRVAELVRADFPGGQLRVDLGSRDLRPPSSTTLLTQLLFTLGVDRWVMPNDIDGLIRMYHKVIAGTQTLLLLDDAEDELQLYPLLPRARGCGVLITSRTGLPAMSGVKRIKLDGFSPEESLEFLDKLVGGGRIAAEEERARDIAEECGHLPAALRISGGLLAARLHWPLGRLADRLADRRRMLDELRLGDLNVAECLASSYRRLRPDARRVLHVLSEFDTTPFSAHSAADMLGLSSQDAQDAIDHLVDTYMLKVDSVDEERYRVPDLVAAFLAQQSHPTHTTASPSSLLDRRRPPAPLHSWRPTRQSRQVASPAAANSVPGPSWPVEASTVGGPVTASPLSDMSHTAKA